MSRLIEGPRLYDQDEQNSAARRQGTLAERVNFKLNTIGSFIGGLIYRPNGSNKPAEQMWQETNLLLVPSADTLPIKNASAKVIYLADIDPERFRGPDHPSAA